MPGSSKQWFEVRALAFFSLVVIIVSLIFVNRSSSASVTAFRQPNRTLMIVLLAVLTMLGVTLLWPFASGPFRFGPLHVDDLTVTLGAGVGALVLLEGLKFLYALSSSRAEILTPQSKGAMR